VGIEALGPALGRERKLLGDLLNILKQQREAVATEDLASVDDTIFSAQRILRTLAEARIKRRTLLEILGADPNIPLDDLEDALGPKVTPELSEEIQVLRTVALQLTGELEVNRKVLQGAIRSGENLITVLGGGQTQDPGVYGPQAEQPRGSGDHGMILDRQI
jgi:hypothetical protein